MEFSSTNTYANRYDLDEINVFLEGNFSNPMFFNISGLPSNLSFGKHYFNLSILNSSNQQYELRVNSTILFEFNKDLLSRPLFKLCDQKSVTVFPIDSVFIFFVNALLIFFVRLQNDPMASIGFRWIFINLAFG